MPHAHTLAIFFTPALRSAILHPTLPSRPSTRGMRHLSILIIIILFYLWFRSAQLNGLYADTMNSLPVLKSVHLNCAQHLGNAQLGSLGNSSQPGISTYGQVSILIVCLCMSHVMTAQMPFGLYSLFGSIARRVILSKHLPRCAEKSRERERESGS